MIRLPESTPARFGAPIFGTVLFIMAALVLLLHPAAGLAAQGNDRIAADVDFLKEPGGTLLGRLSRGAAVTFGARRTGWREVTVTGWIPASALRRDTREGFDVAVNLAAGTPIRAAGENGAAVRGNARAGVLFHEVSRSSGWVQVRRSAWVVSSAVGTAAPATPPPAPPPAAAPPAAATTTTAARPDSTQTRTSILGGSTLVGQPGGGPIATTEVPIQATVTERRDGWSRVRIDAWVRDAAIGATADPDQISGRDVRENPDRYVGQTVEWRLQVLAVRTADELRPELPPGQPYLLARGPLPETGFVYLAIPAGEVAGFRSVAPLTELRVRATIRAGRTRYLQTPVLDFVRKLD